MRIAFFSPLPPTKSGIADYSEVLLEHLRKRADVETFTEIPAQYDPAKYDIAVYQLGNNPHHTFAYEMAMRHPGVVVMHEANLHHLIADLTIRRGDWDAYLREVKINGSPEALAHAEQRVRTLQVGPDYDIPMIRSVLARSHAAIAHSAAVEGELRVAGFEKPVGKIPHGSWIVEGDRMQYRSRLGLDETAPVIGIFGFLKPYKRIAESLRAFRRLIRVAPQARMILVGEAHPELPLASMIGSLGLSAHVRHIGFTPIEDFNGYLSACDIVLNLRYPTVGESSGTLLRALGMGRAVIVSDIGSFREYPDSICLKTPVDSTEEDHLFEYLNLLVSRPDLARTMGARAREWVRSECSWDSVAQQYADFLTSVVENRGWNPSPAAPFDPGMRMDPVRTPPVRAGIPDAPSPAPPVRAGIPDAPSPAPPVKAGIPDAPPPAPPVRAGIPDAPSPAPPVRAGIPDAPPPAPPMRAGIPDAPSPAPPVRAGIPDAPSPAPPVRAGIPDAPPPAPPVRAGIPDAPSPAPSVKAGIPDAPPPAPPVRAGIPDSPSPAPPVRAGIPDAPAAVPVAGDYIASWAPIEDGSRSYVESHLTRLEKTLSITPPGGPDDRILEMGAYLQITPALKTKLGYGEVRGCYFGTAGETNLRAVTSDAGETFDCSVDLFDAEKDIFPYPDGHFSTVLCCELLEHLAGDPMHMMIEINRILKMGGHLVLTTPNIASLRAVAGILQGFHPMLFPAYIRPNADGPTDARHNREYTPRELDALFEISGFEVTLLDTGPFRDEPRPDLRWVEHLLGRYLLSQEHRGDGVYIVGKKVGPAKDRYPSWLYS